MIIQSIVFGTVVCFTFQNLTISHRNPRRNQLTIAPYTQALQLQLKW
jgi:hypothetical protein